LFEENTDCRFQLYGKILTSTTFETLQWGYLKDIIRDKLFSFVDLLKFTGVNMNDIDVTKGPSDRDTHRPAVKARQTINDQKCVTNPRCSSDEIADILSTLVHLSLKDIPLKEQLQLILQHVFSVSWLSLQSKGAVFLVGDDPDVLVMMAQCGLPAPLLSMCERVTFGRCLCGRAALSREVQYVSCVDERHDNLYPGMPPHGHYCVPIETENGVLGVLNFYTEEGHARNEREVEFLRTVTVVLAGIIEHRRVEENLKEVLAKLRKALGGTIQVVASIVERRDPYTAGHQRRVANLARAIATEMGLSQDQRDAIRLSGIIHDVGKISVPAEILTYPGRLGEPEMALIKRHPDIGYETIRMIDFPWAIAEIVRQHHERMDGSGYPQGLSGEHIMMEARVIGVADVVEAMASHRPYRPALGLDKALDEISRNRGILYDAVVVDATLKLLKEKGFQLDREVTD